MADTIKIEARIVNVSTDFGRDLGIRWGGAGRTDSGNGFRYGGSQAATLEQQNNRVQENIVQGGLTMKSTNGRRMSTRAVAGIDSSVKVNRALWMLAEEMRRLKA